MSGFGLNVHPVLFRTVCAMLKKQQQKNKTYEMLTCDVLHFGQTAVISVHCLQKLSSVTRALERRQDQHLAV